MQPLNVIENNEKILAFVYKKIYWDFINGKYI